MKNHSSNSQETIRTQVPVLLRVSEVAKRLNCSPSTVYSLLDTGQLEHHRCPGIRVSEKQLAAYLEQTKKGRTPRPQKIRKTRPKLKHITLK